MAETSLVLYIPCFEGIYMLMLVPNGYRDHYTKYRWKKQCQWLSGVNFVCLCFLLVHSVC